MKLYQIDSFTKAKFKGNPAGVCILEERLNKDQMQAIASEMNLSETAFIEKKGERYGLRWFTPASEVPLCGHATLASAFVLFNEGFHSKNESIFFDTLSGELMVNINSEGALSMDFPGKVPVAYTGNHLDLIRQEFGESIQEILEVPNELIVILESSEAVKNAHPSSDVIAKLSKYGVMISGWDHSGQYDFVSRYFGPNLGIKEDPVTGFIHTILSPYWAKMKDQQSFKCYQASERGGELSTEVKGNRVILNGNAVKIFETDLSLD